jgi:hypothetical protein
VILAGLRKLESSLRDAARRSRTTPHVIVALSSVRSRYDDLMATADNGPGAAPRADLIEAIEAEETPTEDEVARIKELIAALGG